MTRQRPNPAVSSSRPTCTSALRVPPSPSSCSAARSYWDAFPMRRSLHCRHSWPASMIPR